MYRKLQNADLVVQINKIHHQLYATVCCLYVKERCIYSPGTQDTLSVQSYTEVLKAKKSYRYKEQEVL